MEQPVVDDSVWLCGWRKTQPYIGSYHRGRTRLTGHERSGTVFCGVRTQSQLSLPNQRQRTVCQDTNGVLMKRRVPYALIQAMAMVMMLPTGGYAQLPTGVQLQGGNATAVTAPDGNRMDINQTSPRAVLGWSSFNIGTDARVHFNHAGGQGATLNIVNGTTGSLIAGSLTADDSVYLINPHGLTITPGGTVDTGGAFVASTLSVSATDFMNGVRPLNFTGSGALLSNQGTITASDVVLLGNRVDNSGTIVAPMGRMALGSASQATLDLNGGGFLQVLAPASVGMDVLVSNTGEISAEGGLVQLSAATAQHALREAIHMPGVVRAQSVSGSQGVIVFHGGDGGI